MLEKNSNLKKIIDGSNNLYLVIVMIVILGFNVIYGHIVRIVILPSVSILII